VPPAPNPVTLWRPESEFIEDPAFNAATL